MKVVYGDLWNYEKDHPDRWVLITTNGTIKSNGENVMGSGCAREWADRNPHAPKWLGAMLKTNGNHVWAYDFTDQGDDMVHYAPDRVLTFPTKEDVWEPSPIDTIIRSCVELAKIANAMPGSLFILPRPGVGAGGLSWDEVEPVIAPLLPDNVHVITWA